MKANTVQESVLQGLAEDQNFLLSQPFLVFSRQLIVWRIGSLVARSGQRPAITGLSPYSPEEGGERSGRHLFLFCKLSAISLPPSAP